MTDVEVLAAAKSFSFVFVRVTANDYAYDGWIAAAGYKKSGQVRVVVEDVNGRWFIHRPQQLERI